MTQPKSKRAGVAVKCGRLFAAAIVPALFIAGCSSTPSEPTAATDVRDRSIGRVVERPERASSTDSEVSDGDTQIAAPSTVRREFAIPELSSGRDQSIGASNAMQTAPKPNVDVVNVTMETLATERFIDVVFGEMLGVPYTIGEGVADKTDTLRLGSPVSTDSGVFLEWVIDYLKSYQIRVVPTPAGYEIVTDESLMSQIPVLLKNRMRGSVDLELRPVVQFVELKAIAANEMSEMLKKMLPDTATLLIEPNQRLNLITLTGLIEDVDAALRIVDQLDELPYAGTRAERYSPAYWSANELAEEVLKLLAAEGWQASDRQGFQKQILILPIDYSNDLFVFARSPEALARARFWMGELDRATRKGDEPQTFVYNVLNVDAEILAETINAVLSRRNFAGVQQAAPTPVSASPAGATAGANGQRGRQQAFGAVSVGANIVVNRQANQLIFSGTASQYGEIRPLLIQMDQPPAEVLIEVTVAEITLDDSNQYGMQFFLDSLGNDTVSGNLNNSGLGLGAAGTNITLSSGNVSAALNFFAQNNKVNILSTPRLTARSGGTAQIQVGQDVPIVTSQRAANQQDAIGTTDVLQSVAYRSTGVLLTIEPIVFGDNRVDLAVTQEVSSAVATDTSNISSPTISNRNVTTQLSLEDGQTAVLAGLMSSTQTVDEDGAPILKDLPLVGAAFRNTTLTEIRTELLVLITAYVLRGTEDKKQFTDALINQFNAFDATSGDLNTIFRRQEPLRSLDEGRANSRSPQHSSVRSTAAIINASDGEED